ncbi:response regulator [Nostoc sp. 106C]|uniref:response regulator n=1 Tax=Nostoc sp. 106C TaxID=1932667 RepID=UPI000A3C26A0|nr:response regulator [Nostoc sp. 106C]OUL27550.1 histidine kinase [Nostoc sp. 106C]
MLRILLIDDNPNDRHLAIYALKQEFSDLQIQEIGQAQDLEQALAVGQFDLVITDYQLRWSDGLTVLKAIKSRYPDCPVVMFTNSGTQEIAVEAMKLGLDDYVIKSASQLRLPKAVRRAWENTEAKRKVAGLETRLQTLLNNLNVGVYRLQADGTLLEGNPAFFRLVGLNHLNNLPESKTLESYFQPEEYAELLSQLKHNSQGRDAYGGLSCGTLRVACFPEGVHLHQVPEKEVREIPLRRADGTVVWVRLSKTFTTVNGIIIIDGLMEDITERKLSEQQLRESLAREQILRTKAEALEHRSSFLAEASRLLVSSLDYRTTLALVACLAVPTLADLCLVDVVGDNKLITYSEPIVAASNSELEALALELRRSNPPPANANYGSPKVLRTQQPELVMEIPDTSTLATVEDAAHVNFIQQLNITSYLIVPLIARERKLGTMTFALVQSQRHYGRAELEICQELAQRVALAIDNVRLYLDAQKANRVKDEFLAIVSHELRTPLNAMLGWTNLLRTRQMDAVTQAKALETMERNAKLQSKLINDILDISRITQKSLHLNLHPLYLPPVVKAVIDDLQLIAQAKSIIVESSFDAAVDRVLGDTDRLQQIVWNLLSNALKFTPQGGRVSVELKQINSCAQLTVSDTGQGISADFLPYVFDAFRQADATTTRIHTGLGLGLAIVQHLVEMHNGRVFATSDGVGKGATFTVQLPMYQPKLRQPNQDNQARRENFPSLHGLRILVVDDDQDTREMLTFILEQCEIQVSTAASATEALKVLSQSKPDILLCDVGMPNEDGYSLISKVRNQEKDSEMIPAVALTAFARDEDQEKAIAAGFTKHIAKPVNPFELVTVVASLAQRT